ncbi:MAG TPA: hypothetical protein VN376_06375, partial [Longilinea sp.]|nr:hypothetical protein [Longilinea sp.]
NIKDQFLGMKMITGQHNSYQWIEWDMALIADFLTQFPFAVKNKHVICTSLDSSILIPTPEEEKQGWRNYGKVTCSPRITNISSIPYIQFDEWYIFQAPVSPSQFIQAQVFVNYCEFSLHQPKSVDLQDKFWRQIDQIKPEAYLAEGDHLIYVTKNKNHFRKVCKDASSIDKPDRGIHITDEWLVNKQTGRG